MVVVELVVFQYPGRSVQVGFSCYNNAADCNVEHRCWLWLTSWFVSRGAFELSMTTININIILILVSYLSYRYDSTLR